MEERPDSFNTVAGLMKRQHWSNKWKVIQDRNILKQLQNDFWF